MSEGLAFLLFGPSVLVARITVLLFALLAIYFEFRLLQFVINTRTALVASALFAFLPAVLLFEKVVMLEIPALSLGIGAIYFWARYLETERRRDVYWSTDPRKEREKLAAWKLLGKAFIPNLEQLEVTAPTELKIRGLEAGIARRMGDDAAQSEANPFADSNSRRSSAMDSDW